MHENSHIQGKRMNPLESSDRSMSKEKPEPLPGAAPGLNEKIDKNKRYQMDFVRCSKSYSFREKRKKRFPFSLFFNFQPPITAKLLELSKNGKIEDNRNKKLQNGIGLKAISRKKISTFKSRLQPN
ncbi:hypothetical protein TcasGA2_TC004020 [Tribolium castaneum]|uniref:Uncharacterized protein n=1 Tax=Tribolium castaneum TaxID=7070 RepID=D6WIU8_TRICA|nr:hypothetical protein TcasGA2_TC004020 [Tribolium castaneum]